MDDKYHHHGERVLVARLAAHVRWSNCADRAAATAAARKAFNGRWLDQVRAEYPDLDEQSVIRMAASRKKAYFTRLSLLSAQKRANNRRNAGSPAA